MNKLIVHSPQEVHQRVFLAMGLDGADNLIPLFPFVNQTGNCLYRVLKIRAQGNGTVARGVNQSIVRAVKLAKILCIEDGPHMAILRTNALNDSPGVVLGLIIDKQNLIIVLRQLSKHLIPDSLINRPGIFLFIVSGDHN